MEYLCWRRKDFLVSSDLKPPLVDQVLGFLKNKTKHYSIFIHSFTHIFLGYMDTEFENDEKRNTAHSILIVLLESSLLSYLKCLIQKACRISTNSFRANFSFFNFMVRPLYKGGKYSKEETIVFLLFVGKYS